MPTPIQPAGMPVPLGHYVPGMTGAGLLFVSGQLPGPGDAETVSAPFAEQARRAIEAMLAVVEAAGKGPADIVKVTVYLVGIDNWSSFNTIYAALLGDARPARAIVPVPALHHGYLLEIEAVAVA
jgi:2-iminobutanoate/2-iminopropanoate deaminase